MLSVEVSIEFGQFMTMKYCNSHLYINEYFNHSSLFIQKYTKKWSQDKA